MKNRVKAFFKNYPGVSIKPKELAAKLSLVSEHEYASLKHLLHQLCQEGILAKDGKRYKNCGDPLSPEILQGKLSLNNAGYGFVLFSKNKKSDVFISERNLNGAANGDKVEIELLAKQKKSKKNLEGRIVKIIEKHQSGVIKKKLKKKAPGEEISSIAEEFNLPYIFPEDVLAEAEKTSVKVSVREIKKRLDFRNKNVFTIDPDDAKDFDDALSIEKLENGNDSIGIHIADVSYYVKEKSNLDSEASKRGNSVYLVGAVIPMLPEQLSNKICSLVPNEDRLTFSVIVEITARGKIIDYQIAKTVINSKRRFTYEEAQQIIETGNGDLSDDITKLHKIASILRKKRLKEGSVNFFSPEVKFILDENNNPIGIEKKIQKESNNLVEEFMLLANRIVAKHIGFKKINEPEKLFLYRIHDAPDPEKLNEFVRFVKSLGYSINSSDAAKPAFLNKLMDSISGKEEEAVINELAIRCMAKAIYSIENIGHFGLGFDYYTHFTSPIRRYSDLLVHRFLLQYIETSAIKGYSKKRLEGICEHISATERAAVEAERKFIKYKQIQFLYKELGNQYHAIITGVTKFGIFVEITDYLAEGLVHIRDLEGDFYVYDEQKYSLIGRRTKKIFRLGDKIQVKLIRVDEEKLEIDFLVVEE